jgi:UDP-N-acetylglucosamine 1-carboxyvinyltransferase
LKTESKIQLQKLSKNLYFMSEIHNDKLKIGQFIKSLREQKQMTQEDLANLLNTSQSAVARMEAGDQNFTTETLDKISTALNSRIIKLADNSIDFRITGGHSLSGTISTNKSKNGAMGLLCASLLNKGKTVLHGIPYIEEVARILEVMESIGVNIQRDGDTLTLQNPAKFNLEAINGESANKTRSILMFLGALIHTENEFVLPNNQGCKLGKRTISAHLYGLEKFGVKIKVKETGYYVESKNLKPADLVMYEQGDTATENIIIGASKLNGTSTIRFASTNYMVMDVIGFIRKLGVKVEQNGHIITIQGKPDINVDVEYYNSEDPIEAMTFLATGITTSSHITVARCPIDYLGVEMMKLEKMGLKYKVSKPYLSENGFSRLVDITVMPSKLIALEDKIAAQPFPGLNIDNLPFFVPIATQAQGTTLIHDWTYEDRAIYFTELKRLGAKVLLADPHRVYIEGVTKFKATQMVCPPALRPSMLILIAMLTAEGTSTLRNVYSIKRGYQEIAERLNSLGAKIEVINGIN